MKPGAVYRSTGIYLRAMENSGKPQLINAERAVIASNGVPYLQMTSVRSRSIVGMEKEESKERKGRNRKLIHFSWCLNSRDT